MMERRQTESSAREKELSVAEVERLVKHALNNTVSGPKVGRFQSQMLSRKLIMQAKKQKRIQKALLQRSKIINSSKRDKTPTSGREEAKEETTSRPLSTLEQT